jgi:hypothetical protein
MSRKMIVCRKRADYELLTSELNDKLKKKVNIVELPERYQLDQFTPPVDDERVRGRSLLPWEREADMNYSSGGLDLIHGC